MTDNEIINIGDVCIYSYFEENRSISIVEVVKELSEETVVIKFHQVIFDNSGNDLFIYLCNTGRTMNASKKYLRKIDLINRLKAENERLREEVREKTETIAFLKDQAVGWSIDFCNLKAKIDTAKVEAIEEFAERLKESYPQGDRNNKCPALYYDDYCYIIDELLEEMVGESV